jgi:hypothetical protein
MRSWLREGRTPDAAYPPRALGHPARCRLFLTHMLTSQLRNSRRWPNKSRCLEKELADTPGEIAIKIAERNLIVKA